MKKINFRQPKYILPAILYLPVLFVGYMVIDTFNFEAKETKDPRLKTTDYLSGELPEAYTDSLLGTKMENTQDVYGQISDVSGVESVENDRDSVNKKEDYESRYSDAEANRVAQQQAEQEEKKKLQAMQDKVRTNRRNKSTSSSDFVASESDSEIAQVQRMRRRRSYDDMERDLSLDGNESYRASNSSPTSVTGYDENGNPTYGNTYNNTGAGNSQTTPGASKDEEVKEVVKKSKSTSDYFNTIGGNSEKSKLITAIIDEEVKAVDGSRVRLRLLDDIEIEDITVKKGTYLYATMSGFGKQRVNGKVESVFFNEDIIKVNLSIYDTDGLQGLYVPQSQFRETAKDVASSAMQGGNIMDNSSSGSTGVKSWASTAMQNASQRVMNAIGSAAKKNRVRLKYGTKVYLIDESQKKGK